MKELTLKEIEKLLGYKVKVVAEKPKKILKDIPVGEIAAFGDLEFIVLDQLGDCTYLLLKDFWKIDIFDGTSNNYAESKIRKDLNGEFYNKLESLVGWKNIIEHGVDLTTDDGRKDYGKVIDMVSLLTCDMYRKYVDVIDRYRITSNWTWLATAYSTKSNGHSSNVRCVDNFGTLLNNYCSYLLNGVRPFCIFKSDIFVS